MSQGFEHFSDVFFLGWVALKIGLGWIAGQHSMETMFSDFCFGKKQQSMYGEFGRISPNNQFLNGCSGLNNHFLSKDLESSS